MSAPDPSHGTPEMLLEEIAEYADHIQIRANLMRQFAGTGDITGLTYALRQMRAYERALIANVRDLSERRKEFKG